MAGTLRGAGEENGGRCFWGVWVEGVGVAMVSGRTAGEVVAGGSEFFAIYTSCLWLQSLLMAYVVEVRTQCLRHRK